MNDNVLELRQEAQFLLWYDRVYRVVNEQLDVRGSDLATLIVICLDGGGSIFKNVRTRCANRVPGRAFSLIESAVQNGLAEGAGYP